MSDIFISYASEDKGRVQALARALERKGWLVWWDRRIPAGKSFDDVIHEALKAARSVVVVWTRTSVKSTWVKNESRSGLRRNILFPVMLLDEVEIPLEFEHLQAAHLMDWQPGQEHAGFDEFLDDLAGVIGVPSSVAVQPSPVMQTQEPPPAPTSPTPEAEGSLSKSAAEVEPEPERQKPKPKPKSKRKPSSIMAGDVGPDSSVESASSTEVVDVSGDDLESVRSSEDRPSEATGPAPSTESFPYLSIGLGILAAIGALVYFVVFSQGPSPGPRDVVSYQSTVQPPTTRPEVITPTPAPEPIRQPVPATTQEKRTVKKATNTGEAVVTKPRPVAEVEKTITGKDGAPMVLIPAGSFQMGSTEDDVDRAIQTCLKEYKKDQQTCEGWYKGELPQHQISLDAFYLDQYEVTTARYAKFFKETNRRQPVYWSTNVVSAHASKPVVGVDWNDATAYCSWAGKRLPTEAEWEKAARGTDQRSYPWGNEAPSEQRANFNHCCDFEAYGALTDVGLFEQGKSPSGAYDMAGNVWEWTADWYGYYGKSPARNPTGPSSGDFRMLRGGSWTNEPGSVRSASRGRDAPADRDDEVWFPMCPGPSELTFSLWPCFLFSGEFKVLRQPVCPDFVEGRDTLFMVRRAHHERAAGPPGWESS